LHSVNVPYKKVDPESRKQIDTVKPLQIDVPPGVEAGKQFTFELEGNEHPAKLPGDIVIVVKEKPHRHFVRNGANLEYSCLVSKEELAEGGKFEIPSLGNKTKTLHLEGSIKE